MKNIFLRISLSFCSVAMLMSCTSMDHHYEGFWELANKVYVGKVDSLKTNPGKNRIQLVWKKSPDPTVSDVLIYWNNRADSLKVATDGLESEGWLSTIVSGLNEDTHLFTVYALDKEGNRSVAEEIISRVYGDAYERSLVNRVISSVSVNGEDLTIWWFEENSENLIGTEIHYTDNEQIPRIKYHSPEENVAIVEQVNLLKDVRFRSLYRPDSLAIDTFYTSFSPIMFD